MRALDAVGIETTDDKPAVELTVGRTISVPLAWYPRLLNARPEERRRWRLIGGGHGIHWEALDEDIRGRGSWPADAPVRAAPPSSAGWPPGKEAVHRMDELLAELGYCMQRKAL